MCKKNDFSLHLNTTNSFFMQNKPYNNYKSSGVQWLGDIPQHWEVKKITHIFDKIGSGTTPTAGTPKYYDNGEINWLQTGDLTDGLIDFTNKKITPKALAEFSTLKIYPKESLVVAMYGATIGKIGYLNIETATNQACCVLGNPNKFITKFGFYWFMGFKANIVSMGYGGGQPNISQDLIKSLRLPIPPIAEQEKIANYLDEKTTKIDQAINIKKQQIELLRERRQILIHQAVTQGINPDVPLKNSGVEWIGEIPKHWEVKRLKNICEINQNSLPENTNQNFIFKYVDIGSVTLENGILETEEFIFKNAPSRARRIAKVGNSIVSTVRTYLKAIDYIDENKSDYIYSTGFAILQPKNFIYPKFLASFVRSDAFTEQVTINSKGMSYPAINSTDLSILFVVHCGIEEQKQIVEYIETATEKIATAIRLKEQEIEKLKEYKTVLINAAVTGKVMVSSR